ncbi:MAG: phage baseplate assembly protein V [Moraxellaceae bacterium]|nr:phage baseplate assembly protein V [Moraxellaceae bacterium]
MNRDNIFDRPAAWMQAAMLAQVVSLDDPDRRNRVQVRLLSHDYSDTHDAPMWARVVSSFAGNDRGAFFMPEVDDEVLVVFVQGDMRHPLIVGGLWNGASAAPADIQSGGDNRYKRIKSKNGIVITMDEQQGQETLTLETPGGQTVTLKDGPGEITIEDSNGNSVKLETAGITVQASAKVKVQASQVEVTAGMVKVDAALSKFSGMIKCDVLQTNSVISTSYTPGAGNIW